MDTDVLSDTNVLLRTLQPHHALFEPALHAIRHLPRQGYKLCVTVQNLIELWVVMTRPFGENGLGLSHGDAGVELARIKAMFKILPDSPLALDAWERLVLKHEIKGKRSHDVKLVAMMELYRVPGILTFNGSDFVAFPGIRVIDPRET